MYIHCNRKYHFIHAITSTYNVTIQQFRINDDSHIIPSKENTQIPKQNHGKRIVMYYYKPINNKEKTHKYLRKHKLGKTIK